jgi:hypothetical protein
LGVNDMIAIEKDVPIPNAPAGKQRKYDFGKMELGDSFLSTPNKTGNSSNESASFFRYAKIHGWKITRRVVMVNGVKMIRAWRVA